MRKKIMLLLPAVLLFVVSGCSVWEDFSTYFNLYYNTSDLFDQAETSIRDAQKDPFSLQDMQIPGNAQSQIAKVIEKCSKILQFNSQSSFVDNALLMIGKCFYYQKTYIKALRKFDELESSHPESKLFLESRLWHAKTDIQLHNLDRGLAMLVAVKEEAIKKGKEDIATQAFIEEIKYYLALQDYEKVQNLCQQLLMLSSDSGLKAKVAFELGDINERQDKIPEATAAYASVREYTASYDLLFNASIRYAKMLIKLDQANRAIGLLGEMKHQLKYKEFYDQIDLTTALAFKKVGDPDRAFQMLTAFDSLYTGSAQIGNARYERAFMYERQWKNYDSAMVYYQRALGSQATIEYMQRIKDKAATFGKYGTLINSFADAKKQYFYALYPDEFKKDSIAWVLESAKLKAANVKDTTVKVEQVLDRERRFEEVEGDEAIAQINKLLRDTSKTLRPAPRKPMLPADTLKVVLAKNCLELGNLFLTDLSIPDSAYYYYLMITTDYECAQYVPRALYSIGSYYLTLNDSSRADSVFKVLYDTYKTDKIVNEAAAKIGKPKIDFDFDPAKDTFLAAESLYKEKNYTEAYNKFVGIHKNYATSPYASKSLMAAGKILEDKLRLPDSAAVVYDTLVKKYPTSAHAIAIFPKINYYKEEKARLKKVIDDSLNAIKVKAHIEDSLRTFKRDSIANAGKKIAPKPADSTQKVDSLKTIVPAVPAPKDTLGNPEDREEDAVPVKQPVADPKRKAPDTTKPRPEDDAELFRNPFMNSPKSGEQMSFHAGKIIYQRYLV